MKRRSLDGPVPFARGSETSRESARLLRPGIARTRKKVLRAIIAAGPSVGATCKELEDETGMAHETLSSAIKDLKDKFYIEVIGKRSNPQTGRQVWIYAALDRREGRRRYGESLVAKQMKKKDRKKKKLERSVNTLIRSSFNSAKRVWAYKIDDPPVFRGMKTRFNNPRPFDHVVCINGKFVAIETKAMHKIGIFHAKKRMAPHQIEALDAVSKAGGRAFLFIAIWQLPVKGKRKKLNRLYWIDWTRHGSAIQKNPLTRSYFENNRNYMPGTSEGYNINGFLRCEFGIDYATK